VVLTPIRIISLPVASTAVPLDLSPSLPPRRTRRSRTSLPMVFIAPAIVAVFLISIYPIFDAAVLSLFQTRYAEKIKFVGAANYVALWNDASIWASAGKSVVYTGFSLLLVIPLSLGLAMLLNSRIPLRSTARTVIILPWVVSQTVVALLWAWLLNADFGPIAFATQALTGTRPALLASPLGAMAALIVVNVWASYPQATLLLLAAVQTVPQELHEAAHIDGASAWKRFRYVTLPLIRPTLLVVLIQLTLLYFNMVTLVFTLTGGGPLAATDTLALRVLKISFEDWNLGRGAALGLVITAINFLMSALYVKALRQPAALE
jgi:ABC-type sugar transport system permease subunit